MTQISESHLMIMAIGPFLLAVLGTIVVGQLGKIISILQKDDDEEHLVDGRPMDMDDI